jgi:hypothetical protein
MKAALILLLIFLIQTAVWSRTEQFLGFNEEINHGFSSGDHYFIQLHTLISLNHTIRINDLFRLEQNFSIGYSYIKYGLNFMNGVHQITQQYTFYPEFTIGKNRSYFLISAGGFKIKTAPFNYINSYNLKEISTGDPFNPIIWSENQNYIYPYYEFGVGLSQKYGLVLVRGPKDEVLITPFYYHVDLLFGFGYSRNIFSIEHGFGTTVTFRLNRKHPEI